MKRDGNTGGAQGDGESAQYLTAVERLQSLGDICGLDKVVLIPRKSLDALTSLQKKMD